MEFLNKIKELAVQEHQVMVAKIILEKKLNLWQISQKILFKKIQMNN